MDLNKNFEIADKLQVHEHPMPVLENSLDHELDNSKHLQSSGGSLSQHEGGSLEDTSPNDEAQRSDRDKFNKTQQA